MGNDLCAPHPGNSVEKDPEVTHTWAQWERVLSSTPHMFKRAHFPSTLSPNYILNAATSHHVCLSLGQTLQRSVNW